MLFDAPTLGPGIRIIVVPYISEQRARARLVNDDAYVAVDADRPEVWILRLVDSMILKPRSVWLSLQIEGGQLRLLLLLPIELSERSCEAVGEDSRHFVKSARRTSRRGT